MKINPRFMVIEGLSGSGKSTLARRIVARLEAERAPAFYNAEPTKENPMPFGKVIRQIIEGRKLDQSEVYACIGAIWCLYEQLAKSSANWRTQMRPLLIYKLFDNIESKLSQMADLGDKKNLLNELELQTLFLIDRRYDLEYAIEPKTARGNILVQDRYELTTFAYGGSRGLFIEDMWNLQVLITGEHYRVPILTVVFKVDPATAAARLQSSVKTLDRFEMTA